MQLRLSRLTVLGLGFLLSACGPQGGFQGTMHFIDEGAPSAPNEPDEAIIMDSPIQACPKLSFAGVTWASQFTQFDREAFKIALSISGSYEGNNGWKNITGNFDGTGMSLGLLNQNFGSGTLQPMLLKMMSRSPKAWAQIFSDDHRKSLEAMLLSWSGGVKAFDFDFQDQEAETAEEVEEIQFNRLDYNFIHTLTPQASASVSWATQNLYQANGQFVPQWKAEFVKLAAHPDYVSLQIEAAHSYRNKAYGYHQSLSSRT